MTVSNGEYCYLGILANVDETILKISLKNGYTIRKLGGYELTDLIEGLTGQQGDDVFQMLTQLNCVEYNPKSTSAQDMHYIYVVTNKLDITIATNAIVEINKKVKHMWTGATLFGYSYSTYLDDLLGLLRLIKPGSVCIAAEYYYFGTDPLKGSHKFQQSLISKEINPDRSTFEDGDLVELMKIKGVSHKLNSVKALKIAYNALESSHHIFYSPNLAFITLMISLEALLSEKGERITEDLSRGVAFLLGDESLYTETRKLYGLRCDLIHGNKSIEVPPETVNRLRWIVRKVVLQILVMDKTKKQIIKQIREQWKISRCDRVLLWIKGFFGDR